jgi:hypothetical protein
MPRMNEYLLIGLITFGALLLGTVVLHVLPKLGRGGRAIMEWCSAAPGLDVVVAYFTAAPMIVGPILGGWLGLAASVAAQVLALLVWSWFHGLAHGTARKGPRIVKVLNELVGAPRNYAALWVTTVVVPMFWAVRVAEILVYPFLIWIVRFPRYKHREWVCVSRHKFDGLVGHDLIWCLYCDWMTGVWALASEMLRNVESFWCPIRFHSTNKCDNCSHDFPDIYRGWIPTDGTMEDVTAVIKKYYGEAEINAWFGHPARMTVEGETPPRPTQ